jgi:hypothetical protein
MCLAYAGALFVGASLLAIFGVDLVSPFLEQGVQIKHSQRTDSDFKAPLVTQPRYAGLLVSVDGLFDAGAAYLFRYGWPIVVTLWELVHGQPLR